MLWEKVYEAVANVHITETYKANCAQGIYTCKLRHTQCNALIRIPEVGKEVALRLAVSDILYAIVGAVAIYACIYVFGVNSYAIPY